MVWIVGSLFAVAVLVACGGIDRDEKFGPVASPVSELVGTELSANSVVDLPCIPSRRDPVGVWLAMRVDRAVPAADSFLLGLEQTDARLGSHPSGCRAPELLLAQSVFLLDDNDDPIFAAKEAVIDGVTLLEFDLEGPAVDHELMVVPTFRFEKKDGNLETTIFGTVGRYSIDAD